MHGTAWIPSPGELIGDRYQLGEEIGRGGMGVVHAGLDTRLHRPVALKFLDPDLVGDVEALGRFQREAMTAGRLGHENICDVRDHGTTVSGAPYIVMELLDGQPASRLLAAVGRLSPREAIEIVLQVLSALEAAHAEGIIHRDLKPENVFLTEGLGGRRRVKLVDFGISKFVGDDAGLRLTKTGIVMGSPYFMSPEQARGQEEIDQRSDIWSVGVILFELLTGDLPFKGANYNEVMVRIVTEEPPRPRELCPEIPEALEAALLEALAPDRDERYGNAAEFAAALEACLAGLGPEDPAVASRGTQHTMKVGARRRVKRKRRTRIAIVAVIGVVVALGVVAGVALTLRAGRAPARRPVAPVAAAPRATPAAPALPVVEPLPPVAAPRARVQLVGVPSGVRLTFDGALVEGDELVGRPGQRGTLEVLAPDAPPLSMEVALTDGAAIDVAAALAAPAPPERPSARRRDAGAQAQAASPPADAGPDASAPTRDRYIPGTGGAKALTTYGGP